jgi:hypothetical protein
VEGLPRLVRRKGIAASEYDTFAPKRAVSRNEVPERRQVKRARPIAAGHCAQNGHTCDAIDGSGKRHEAVQSGGMVYRSQGGHRMHSVAGQLW